MRFLQTPVIGLNEIKSGMALNRLFIFIVWSQDTAILNKKLKRFYLSVQNFYVLLILSVEVLWRFAIKNTWKKNLIIN